MKRNEALMTRARRLNPAPAEAFQNLAHSSEAQETLDAILQAPLPAGSMRAMPPQATPRSAADTSAPRPAVGLRAIARMTAAIVAVAAVVIGIISVGTSDRQGGSGDTAWGAELVRIAQESPRLLIGQDGWTVTRADEFSAELGEMTFEKDQFWMDLFWNPADTHEDWVKDRKRGAGASWKVTIAGHEAVLLRRQGTTPMGTPTLTALWLDGEHSLELRSDVIPTVDEFRTIAATVHVVDVDTWLSAMPASVVNPDGRGQAVERTLSDVPIPSSVDIERLKKGETVSNRSSLEYEVTLAIVCGWVQQWIDGTKAADEVAVSESVDAMAGSHHWAVMKRYGGASYVFEVAEAMATNSPINGERSVPVGVGYQRHLGCAEG